LESDQVGVSPSSDFVVTTDIACSFHFGALAHDNEALSQKIVTPAPSTSTLPVHLGSYTTEDDLSSKFETPTPFLLEGTQTVRKFRSDRPTEELPAPDEITILVALWRVLLDNGSPDGRPIPEDEDDEAMRVEGQTKVQWGRYADVLCSVNVNMAKNDAAQVNEVRKWFGTATKNMRIRDYSLFVEVEKDV
jgi:hypothetical protein